MLHLLPCLITFNLVGYINERELNKSCGVFFNMQLRCILSSTSFVRLFVHFAMPCLIKPDMHHTCLRIVSCLCGGCLRCLCASFRCCFFGLVPVTSRLWGPVRLHPFVFFMDPFFFLAGFQARWSYPRNHYYLCYARFARSFAMPMLWCLPLACQPPKLPCSASNPPMS